MHAVVLMIAGVLLATPAAAQDDGRRPGTTDDIEVVRDVEFGTTGDRPLRLHLVRPRQQPEGPMPVVVWIHGGGWRAGSRDAGMARLLPLARRGFLGASVEYRLSGEAPFPAQIEDCKAAIRYLRAHSDELGIDPDRIGVWGASAGGHLAALLGTSGGVEELEGSGGNPGPSSRVQSVCDFYGPTDFLRMNDTTGRIDHNAPDSPESLLIGGPIQENPEQVARANPITYVSPDDPPFLIVHGDRDPLVPPGQSELLRDALREAGVPVTLHVVEGGGHGQGFPPEVFGMVADFFERTLRADPADADPNPKDSDRR